MTSEFSIRLSHNQNTFPQIQRDLGDEGEEKNTLWIEARWIWLQ